jgi:8-oxo-dGTP diphosphatase
MLHKVIGVAVIWNDQGQVLIDRRKPGGAMGGFWEFPGGKLEPDETILDCIRREIQEELAMEIVVGESLITIEHDYPDLKVSLHVHHCEHIAGEPTPIECDEIRWVYPTELDQFSFPEANAQVLAAVQAYVLTPDVD